VGLGGGIRGRLDLDALAVIELALLIAALVLAVHGEPLN
jgi:hypothetical protein